MLRQEPTPKRNTQAEPTTSRRVKLFTKTAIRREYRSLPTPADIVPLLNRQRELGYCHS
jgi:hypothetical protein